jgi:prolyl 4-hydroxylase
VSGGVAAEALARLPRGDARTARALVDRACAAGDADALAMRALWQVEGKLLPRDLPAARDGLSRAAQSGNMGAARMLGGLMAAGVGGPRDWPGALELLALWRDRDTLAARQHDVIAAMAIDAQGDPLAVPAAVPLADRPMVHSLPGLLTPAECALLADLAERRLRPALIFHDSQRRFVPDPIRDSDAAGFPILSEWPAVHAINRRLARASGTQVEQGEALQLLRYRPGQQYRPHLDALPGLGNQRILTLLVYLSDDHEGGETHFIRVGLTVSARRGDGLLFANALPDGRPDPMSEHAGLPVRAGVKLLASRWIRQHPPTHADGFGQHEMAG